jgi:alanine racemase
VTDPRTDNQELRRQAPEGFLQVNLAALARNYHRLQQAAPEAECAAVVKADAYGLGIQKVARRLADEGCKTFFVTNYDEGFELREILPKAVIYVLDSVPPGQEQDFLQHNLRPVLNSPEQVRRWNDFAGKSSANLAGANCAIHIDTGMNRLGLERADVEALREHPEWLKELAVDFVMTHLACADRPEHPLNRRQVEIFDELRQGIPHLRTSIANSAGTLLGSPFQGDIVRPGFAIYGGNPFADRDNPMEEVIRLQGRVSQVRALPSGETVGYGASYTSARPARIATITVGYANGYPRNLGNKAYVAIGGQKAPIVGRVSMDLITVDVSGIEQPPVKPGTLADVVGGDIDLDELASLAGTVGYELMTGLGRGLPRLYIEE